MRSIVALFLVLLSLPSFAAITGTVMTSDGVAIADARVSIHALETPEARRRRLVSTTPGTTPLASARTDAKGSFSLASKEPVVDLRVQMRGYAPFVRRVEGDGDPVAVALRKIDMVKGSVTAGGKPVAKALVVLGDDFVTRSDEQGLYEAPAIQPPYVLTVIHPDYAIDEERVPTRTLPERELTRTLSAGVTLTGRAVGADGTSAVAGAEIAVDGWPLAVSGKDGAFTIAHVPTKWTAITARKGMMSGTHTAGGAKTIIVRLEPLAVLSGGVRDAKTNEPLAGAMVKVTVWSEGGMTGPAAITDAAGTYSIPVPAGSFELSSEHPSSLPNSAGVTIASGQQRTHDFALKPLARVSGVILDEAGRPVSAATVSPRDARDRGIPDMAANGALPVTAGVDGKFDVRVLPGSNVSLHVRKKGLPQGRSAVMRLGEGERRSAVDVTIPLGVAVTGRALDAGGKPLSGVSVVAGPGVAPGGVETLYTVLESLEQDPVRSAADGTFAMRLTEGTYNFWFRRDGYLRTQVRAKSITAGGDNAVEARLDPAVEISGRVMRGGVGVADVEIASEGPTATTAFDGSFVLGGVSPGVRELELRKREERIDEKRSITAPARGVTIDLPPGGTILGRVVEKGTKMPIRSFRAGVLVEPRDTKRFISEDGSFTLEHVPAGTVGVSIKAAGYADTCRNVRVVAGESLTDLVVELETRTDANGAAPDASIAVPSGWGIITDNPTRGPVPCSR